MFFFSRRCVLWLAEVPSGRIEYKISGVEDSLRADFRLREKHPASSPATATVSIGGGEGLYTYDAFRNRQLQSLQTTACSASYTPTVTYNSNNQVTGVHENWGQTSLNGTYTYDLAGDVTNDITNQYAYDGGWPRSRDRSLPR